MKRRILVLGNYNALNIGDDLILNGVIKSLEDNNDFFEYKIMAPNRPCDYFIFPTGIRSFFSFKWLPTLLKLFKTDVLVFGGGGLLNPEEYKSLLIWGFQILIARLFGLKVVMLANSFPFSNSKLYRYLLSKIDFFTVRDDQSYNFLNKLELNVPVKRTSDFVYLANIENFIDPELDFDSDDFIVLNLRSYSKIDFELQLNFYLDFVDYITNNTNLSIYLLPFANDDLVFLRMLNNKTASNGRVFLLPFEKDVLITAISKSKLVVSQRLHSALVAQLLSKPVISLSYSAKTSSLLSEYSDLPVFDLRSSSFSFETVKPVLTSILDKTYDCNIVKNIKITENNKKRASMNFALLKTFLE